MRTPLTIEYAESADQARHLVEDGFCPVECSFGAESVVDDLQMDHHGAMSHLDGVAVRAYRDHFGARREDARFVVTGAADADATFAIASLAGLLPTGLLSLAELVNRADIHPIGLRLEESDAGKKLLLFKALASGEHDAPAFYAGVDRWRLLCGECSPRALLQAIGNAEADRVQQAREAQIEKLNEGVAFIESAVWGYDVWYAEVAPVIVAYLAKPGRASIGCRDEAIATRFFGNGGLQNVYALLQPAGWGGRETVGGSPRNVIISREQALTAARQAAQLAQLSTPTAIPQ